MAVPGGSSPDAAALVNITSGRNGRVVAAFSGRGRSEPPAQPHGHETVASGGVIGWQPIGGAQSAGMTKLSGRTSGAGSAQDDSGKQNSWSNQEGVAFKGFVPAVFGRLVNKRFYELVEDQAASRVTARPRGNLTDCTQGSRRGPVRAAAGCTADDRGAATVTLMGVEKYIS